MKEENKTFKLLENSAVVKAEISNTSESPKKFNLGVSLGWKPHSISLPDRVDFILNSKGHSRNWLADEIDINKGTLSKILNGLWKPTFRIKLLMAQKLEVDSLVLFGDSEYFKDYQKTIQKVGGKNNGAIC